MKNLNDKIKEANQTSEGFHPPLFVVKFNFEGIGDIPKIMNDFAYDINISQKLQTSEVVPSYKSYNVIDIGFTIDTTSTDFKSLLNYLLMLKGKTQISEKKRDILGSITIYYYSKDGSIFMKRQLHGVGFNYNKNSYDIFDKLSYDAKPIHVLDASFIYEKIENEI